MNSIFIDIKLTIADTIKNRFSLIKVRTRIDSNLNSLLCTRNISSILHLEIKDLRMEGTSFILFTCLFVSRTIGLFYSSKLPSLYAFCLSRRVFQQQYMIFSNHT